MVQSFLRMIQPVRENHREHLSNENNPWLFRVCRDYTTQVYRDYIYNTIISGSFEVYRIVLGNIDMNETETPLLRSWNLRHFSF